MTESSAAVAVEDQKGLSEGSDPATGMRLSGELSTAVLIGVDKVMVEE